MRIKFSPHGRFNYRANRGVTLVELIVFILVISIALGGLLGVYQFSVVNSADPVKRARMLQYAQAQLDTALALRFDQSPSAPSPDYPEPSSTFYQRSISVTPATLASHASVNLKLIEVTVTTTDGESLTLSGYRADF